MTRQLPTLEQVRQLPVLLTLTIPSDWLDYNGHVNVRSYMTLYERAGWPMLSEAGLDPAEFDRSGLGIFDLENHIRYLAELRAGDLVSMHGRLLARSSKRLQGMLFTVNDTRELLSCVFEFVTSSVDLRTRHSAPFAKDVARLLDGMIGRHQSLTWTAPTCGVISA